MVGIGASAGGLEALGLFLKNVPDKSGMAFIIIQHMDPTHKGMLVELLGRITKMPVIQIKDRTIVKPDYVYVIPPNKDLSILNGILHLFPPAESRGLRLPIDYFFRSMAKDQKEKSVGVILLGMGTDGTLGLKAIKEAGGMVFIQSPNSAKFDGMPKSAIDSGLPSVVAPVEELPGKIVAYLKRLPIVTKSDDFFENEEKEKRAAELTIANKHYSAQLLLRSGIESPQGLSILAIDKDYNYLFFNRAHKDVMVYMYGKEVEVGMNILDCITSEVDKVNTRANYEHALNGKTHTTIQEFGDKKCSHYETFYNPIISENNKITGATAFSRDITERKKYEEEILHLSYHDTMTGLYNRSFFDEEKKRLNVKRQLPLSVIMGDLNGLKLINDAFGHIEGDKIIKKAAEILKRVCRSDDIVARWGGDEFVMLLPKTSASDSEEILERIKRECEKTVSQKIPLSISLGTATKEEISQPIDVIVIDSESNMYKNKLGERESISNSIVAALEQALYEKSHETADHTGRIKELALKLGRQVKLTSSQLDDLLLLASLHDIGKVAAPETILNKKGKLTEKEREIIKRHPVVGFNIAIASTQIAHVAKPILACHEHWDGSGYPNGLKGDSIPINSRIILIADAYAVMTSGRIYKEPVSKNDAIDELKRCSGTQFDPMLVNEFIETISGNI